MNVRLCTYMGDERLGATADDGRARLYVLSVTVCPKWAELCTRLSPALPFAQERMGEKEDKTGEDLHPATFMRMHLMGQEISPSMRQAYNRASQKVRGS